VDLQGRDLVKYKWFQTEGSGTSEVGLTDIVTDAELDEFGIREILGDANSLEEILRYVRIILPHFCTNNGVVNIKTRRLQFILAVMRNNFNHTERDVIDQNTFEGGSYTSK